MPFVTAIKTDIRNEILRSLQSDITFLCSPNDANAPILPTSIIRQKIRAQPGREDSYENQMMDMPGLILCSPKRLSLPVNGGQNNQDLWIYTWMVQLVDRDLWDSTDRLDSWEKWVEQIISAFHFNQMNTVIPISKGNLLCSTATGVSDIDQNQWIREGNFIAGVEIEAQVLQPRGIIA